MWRVVRNSWCPQGRSDALWFLIQLVSLIYLTCLALDRINERSDFLRGLKLGALIVDSCSNPSYALNQSLDFVRDMIGSTDASEFQCADGKKPYLLDNAKHSKVVAVVGGSYSSVTVQVANLLRLFRIVQVSPASSKQTLFNLFLLM